MLSWEERVALCVISCTYLTWIDFTYVRVALGYVLLAHESDTRLDASSQQRAGGRGLRLGRRAML